MPARFYPPEYSIDPRSDNAFSDEELDDIVDLVRESSFLDDESGKSIDERMELLFGEPPVWTGFQTPDEEIYVNCGGSVKNGENEAELILQFALSYDLESFVLSAMLINGAEQSESFITKFEAQFSQ